MIRTTGADGYLHVVAAVVLDAGGRVLIQRRHDGAHQGGLWEFPGGKLEPGEAPWPGLVRELAEELGIHAACGRPLIRVPHVYPDRRVLLDVWRVESWCGEPKALEDQPLEWVTLDALARYGFPAADRPVLRALELPACYLVTPDPGPEDSPWLDALERAAGEGVRLVQIRATNRTAPGYRRLARLALDRLRRGPHRVRVLLNAAPGLAEELGADGTHLNARRLLRTSQRPLARSALVAASCHDARELAQAQTLEVDFAVLGPVAATRSHPGAAPIGWRAFEDLVGPAPFPVFALGGMAPGDLDRAWRAGAQGIAAIGSLWPRVPGSRAVSR